MEKITDKIAALPQDGSYFSLEFFPPKTQTGLSNLQARLERMSKALKPLFINVTWGAGGSTAEKSLELAEICQRHMGLTTCLHLTCTNMSRKLVDEALSKAKAIGVRNILALRGDPPRSEEYGLTADTVADGHTSGSEEPIPEFNWAADLVRYIKKRYGDYFCIGVATYPEGHADQSHPEHQDPQFDLPYLIEKTSAGADFLMTQLFYDVEAFEKFELMLRNDPSRVFQTIPIIPGLMPIQSYQVLRRTTKLSHAKLPTNLLARIDAVRGDDDAVKRVGLDILSEIVERLKSRPNLAPHPKGFHFYTLNLEKAVSQIVERCGLIQNLLCESDSEEDAVVAVTSDISVCDTKRRERRRLSSINSNPRNRVVVDRPSISSNKGYEALQHEAGVPMDGHSTRATALAISEGHGALGREATWDDFPNGRWGDARSPAFGEIDGYGPSLHVSVAQAIKLWGYPASKADISDVFKRYIAGDVTAIPWSEEGLLPETVAIKDQLLRINSKGWWTVASQPSLNGVRSTDEVFGWGPKGGFCFQKCFVELFLPSGDWMHLRQKLQENANITYFAGNADGEFESSDPQSVNPVTWGTFPSKEIVTPTIIEKNSFVAWREEAFSIWTEWQRLYPIHLPASELLRGIRDDYWLVNIIHHDYQDKGALWAILLD